MRLSYLTTFVIGLIIHVTQVSGQMAWLTNVAGGGNGENQPASSIGLRANSIAIDSRGNIYVADHDSNIKKIDAETGLVSIFTISSISTKVFLFIDKSDNLFIVDNQENTIQKFSLATSSIATIAGTGENGYGGDGGLAVNAKLSGPSGGIIDENGDIFVIDTGNNRIRKIDGSGVITTIAGNGIAGFGGDGGEATSAILNNPLGLAKDLQNNLYISDYLNQRIRKIDPSGIITTIAGFGPGTYIGDDMPAANTTFNGPVGLHFDGNNFLYVADRFNRRVRKIDLTTEFISLVAGNGIGASTGDGGPAVDASMVVPSYIIADRNNNLYIADDWEYNSNGIIRKISLSTGIITTIAGNKGSKFCCDEEITAKQAQFSNIGGIAVDASGNILIADVDGNRIRKVDKQGIVTTVAGDGYSYESSGDGGDARQAQTPRPSDVATDNAGNIFLTQGHTLRKIDANNMITTIAGGETNGTSGDGGLATDALLDDAHSLHVDAGGNIYIAQLSTVRKIDALTGIITTIAGGGTSGDGELAIKAKLDNIQDITVDLQGNLYITEFGVNAGIGGKVRKVAIATGIITTIAGNGSLGFSGDGGLAVNAQMSAVTAVAVDDNNNIYIGDGARVRMVNSDGIINTIAGDGNYGWTDGDYFATLVPIGLTFGLAVDQDNNLLITSFDRVKKLLFQQEITDVAESLADGITVYPNPFQDHVTIKLPLGRQGRKFAASIIDAFGRTLTSMNTTDEEITFSCRECSKGIYVLILQDGTQTITKKIIKD